VAAPGHTAEDLAERLLAGDKRALARAISLVENDDPEGWALVREVYPRTGRAAVGGQDAGRLAIDGCSQHLGAGSNVGHAQPGPTRGIRRVPALRQMDAQVTTDADDAAVSVDEWHRGLHSSEVKVGKPYPHTGGRYLRDP